MALQFTLHAEPTVKTAVMGKEIHDIKYKPPMRLYDIKHLGAWRLSPGDSYHL